MRIAGWSLVLAMLLAATGGAAAAANDEAWSRPLSEAERRAVELAVAYLDRGPEAWWPELAADAPIRGLGESAAIDEIAVRAGPPDGARWRLQTPAPGTPEGTAVLSIAFPSGVEETLTLALVEEDGAWRIRELRSLVDPGHPEDLFWDRPSVPALGALPAAPPGAWWGLTGLLILAAALAAWRPTPRWRGVAVAVGISALGALLACRPDPAPAPAPSAPATLPADVPMIQSLGSLRELRWAIATGVSARAIDEMFARAPAAEDLAAIAGLWRAETLLSQVDLTAAEELLREVPDPSPVPLGDLLRARLAYARGEADEAVALYEAAAEAGTDHDGLRLETAQVLADLGRTIESEVMFTQAAEMGSRLGEVHYAMAQLAALSQRMELGEKHLALAWRLEPVLRERLFADPLLSSLCARPSLFGTFSFSTPDEPSVVPADRGRHPIALPASASADLSGELLRLAVGSAELYVPGGAELAPASARVETALDRRLRVEDQVLDRLPVLFVEARTAAVLARPERREEILQAAAALARHNRWDEVVTLTDGIAGAVEKTPLALGQLRAEALRRRGREGDAQALLVRLAKTSLESKRRDPGALRQLAELFVAGRDYDLAIRLIQRAEQLSPFGSGDQRIRQIRLEQELYAAPRYHRRPHFEIVYPGYTSPRYAAALGSVLEDELQRISRWVPIARGERHTVNLYPIGQFLDAYSGGVLVLGIYDGRLRVPLADLPSLHPQLVSVLSHELAHGMIARATDDQAPKWFHEGLAQHIEMVPGRINPIPDLVREGRVLAFPMIEAILDGFSEPQLVDLAYGEAAWVVHYLEAEHGVRSIRRLIDAFGRGLTTEEALQEVLGMSVPDFDRAVWSWCLHEAPAAWPTELRRYDRELGGVVQRSDLRTARPSSEGRARAEIRSWHALYTGATREVRNTLGRVVGPIRAGGPLPRAACTELGRQVTTVMEDPRILDAPVASLRQHLQVAFETLGEMAAACSKGEIAASQRTLGVAEGALGRAARELESYDLAP